MGGETEIEPEGKAPDMSSKEKEEGRMRLGRIRRLLDMYVEYVCSIISSNSRCRTGCSGSNFSSAAWDGKHDEGYHYRRRTK